MVEQDISVDVYKTLSAPLDVQVEVTTRCNEACMHCYNFWRGEQFRGQVANFPQQTLQKGQLSYIIAELIQYKVFSVTFTGGEPFLYRSTTIEGIRQAQEGGLDCSLNSNLTTMTLAMARRLKEVGLGAVLTSLHSSDELTHDTITQRKGSFKRTLLGIEACQAAELSVAANMVVTKMNQNQVFETGAFVKELGVKSFSATKATPCLGGTNFAEISIGREAFKQMLEDLLRLEKDERIDVNVLISYPLCALEDGKRFRKFAERSCAAGVTTCTIGADGEIRPCSFADETYGNIFSEPFNQVWLRMRDWRDGSRLPEQCVSECQYFPLCGAGCRLEAKFAGDRKGMDPLATDSLDVKFPPVTEFDHAPADFWKKQLIVASNLKLRRENFGGIIAPQGRQPVFIDSTAYEIIDKLKHTSSPFSFKGIEDDYHLSQTSSDFFFALFAKGVFREV